jgi:hypothetical protein
LHDDEQLYAAWLEVGLARCGREFGELAGCEARLEEAGAAFLQSIERMQNAMKILDGHNPPAKALMRIPLPANSGESAAS